MQRFCYIYILSRRPEHDSSNDDVSCGYNGIYSVPNAIDTSMDDKKNIKLLPDSLSYPVFLAKRRKKKKKVVPNEGQGSTEGTVY